MLPTRLFGRIAAFVLLSCAAATPLAAQPKRGKELATPAPQNVTAVYTASGVQVSWERVAPAVQYVVVRAPNAGAPGTPIGKVAPTALSFIDQGFNAAAAYQVVAVMANGSFGTSAMVAYVPPAGRPIAIVDPRREKAPAAAPPAAAAPPPAPVRQRRITSVEKIVIRAGGRFKIHGEAFAARPGEMIATVTGAYFGNGVPGTMGNPRFSIIGDAFDTSVDILTTSTCNQEGILLLSAPGMGTASEDNFGAVPPIRVTCASSTPAGRLVGSEAAPNGVLAVAAGTTVTIQGTNLRLVTRVVDTFKNAYPFTLSGDRIVLTAPAVRPGGPDFFSLQLENPLTDPVVNGVVTGTLRVLVPPT